MVYRAYYRWVYGRTFAGSVRLQGKVQQIERLLARGDVPAERDVWDEKFRSGSWDYMRDLHESPRYASLAVIVHAVGGGEATILDVGCGEGLLVDHLRHHGYREYLGIDISEQAILAAAGRQDERTSFLTADAEHFDANGRIFDVIVFNECLYYLREPARAVETYDECLAPSGSLILSTFRTPRSDAIARLVVNRFPIVEEFEVRNRLGTWVLRVLGRDATAAARPGV